MRRKRRGKGGEEREKEEREGEREREAEKEEELKSRTSDFLNHASSRTPATLRDAKTAKNKEHREGERWWSS